LEFDDELKKTALEQRFQIDGCRFSAASEQLRPPRIVRVAGIQNSIVEPTDAPVAQQRDAIHKRVAQMIEAAARGGANVICMQEAWSKDV
jgi:beta-ureidopropionase